MTYKFFKQRNILSNICKMKTM